jgi:hypothetical protein
MTCAAMTLGKKVGASVAGLFPSTASCGCLYMISELFFGAGEVARVCGQR